MNLLVVYSVVALVVAAIASVVSDRFRSNAGASVLLAGLLWPVVVVGVVQVALWAAVVKAARATAPAPARRPVREFADARTD